MYNIKDIKQVHLEVTTNCNASCPQCSRNMSGGAVNPSLPLTELKLKDCRKIFSEFFVQQLESLFVCGNYGDPLMASDTIEILEYFRKNNPKIVLGIHTNASGRNKDWWERLANVVTYCRFSIDGLEDTNHIYRRNTVWSNIMQSVEWYINANGAADWDFIVFKHNQHQVHDAYLLSKKLGFKKFNVRKTPRFYNPVNSVPLSKINVFNKLSEIEYSIQPPDNPDYINISNASLSEFIKNEQDFNKYLESTTIQCNSVKNKQIYVSAEGLVFPCCYLSDIYRVKPGFNISQVLEIIKLIPEGKDSLNAKKYSVEKILSEKIFQKIVPESWYKSSFSEGRLYTCAKTCGNYKLCSNSQTYTPKP